MRAAARRGEDLGLWEENPASYDALDGNESAVKVLGNEMFKVIGCELV